MAQPIAKTTTLSSAGTSTAILLDPMARVTMATLYLADLAGSSGGGTTDLIVQATIDVPGVVGGTSQYWTNISTTHYSSANGDGVFLSISSPVAGLRLYSSTWAGGTSTVTLTALQEIIA